MEAKHVDILIHDYLEGNLNDSDKQAFNSHIKVCESCRGEFEFVKNAFELLDIEAKQELPVFVENRIIKSIIEFESKDLYKRRFVYIIQKVAVAAVLIIGIISGFIIGNRFELAGSEEAKTYSSEFYVSDLTHEPVEALFLNE